MRIFQNQFFKQLCLFLLFTSACQSLAYGYTVTNIVSSGPSVEAKAIDRDLQIPWGLTINGNGRLIIAVNGRNVVKTYTVQGDLQKDPFNAFFLPTGIIRNDDRAAFLYPPNSILNAIFARFLIATELGTILAFNSNSIVDPGSAFVVVDRQGEGSIYTGITIATVNNQPRLYATNFASGLNDGNIDVFDSQFNLIQQFSIPVRPLGFSPFNIVNINNKLFVTFAEKDSSGRVDLEGEGFVAIFSPEGIFERAITSPQLKAPWGIALAPNNFGEFSNALLVGDFGNGRINAFNVNTGEFLGQLQTNGNDIVITGLLALSFGVESRSDVLFFTSVPHLNQPTPGGLIGLIRK